MAKPLDWLFKITDKLSGPSDRMAKVLDHQADETDKAAKATDRLSDATERGGHAAGKAKEQHEGLRHKLYETVELLHRGYEVGERFVDFFVDMGKEAIHAAAGAERSADSIKALLGEAEGTDVLEYLEKVSKYTEFDDSDLRQLVMALADAGFEANELNKALAFSGDVAAIRGGGINNAMGAVGVLERVKLSGAIDKRTLRKLGIEAKPFFEQLGHELGTSAKLAQDKAAAGGIKPDVLLDSLYRAVQAKEGGPLGTMAIKASKSLDALWEKVNKLKENFFEGLADGKAMQELKAFLGNVLAALDPASPFGKEITDTIDRMFSDTFKALFGDLSGPDGVMKIRDAVLQMEQDLKDAWPDIISAAKDALVVIKGIAGAVGLIAEAMRPFTEEGKKRVLADIHTQSTALDRAGHGAVWKFFFSGTGRGRNAANEQLAREGALNPDVMSVIDSGVPEAHDFIWRAGRAIRLDPADTLVGAKGSSGEALAAFGSDTGGSPMGWGGVVWNGNVVVNVDAGGVADPQEIASLAAEAAREEVYSVLENFGDEAGDER